ncbi:allantoate deiminase [Evansella vedderi]|uniref:Allantoate deiminase n=1 Tax=Evansella vedderi TaxID=38282 RepID=A0ABT9ZV34_9BACI|nr:Zn-dependent hydrolase [Evansella vedderi]MDQ0255106.1 allantoate deiminase [Evansella vedderi]
METEEFANQFFKKLMGEYDHQQYSHSGIDGHRVANRLAELSRIGLTPEGGSSRMGFSKEEREAKELVKSWMKEAGLSVREDGAGNVFGRLEGKVKGEAAVLSGSHVDSVPNGGHFDGPLGVLAALEVVEAWRETGFVPNKPYEVVIFTDEEGSRFNGGLLGSEAMIGEIDREHMLKLVDVYGNSFEQVLTEYGLSVDHFFTSERVLSEVAAFVEVHIEQGKRLEKEDLPVGIVTGIAGPCWMEISFIGEAGHAGNTPMDDRADALIAASRFVSKVEELPSVVSPSAVATVGRLHVYPNGVNVIPGKVTLTVDIRDIHEETRDELVEKIVLLGEQVAAERGVSVEMNEKTRIMPVPVSEEMQRKGKAAVEKLGYRPYYLPSGAGHDAMIVGRKVPAAMLFTRSKDGVSHNPKEWSSLNDCVATIHVLKNMVEELVK